MKKWTFVILLLILMVIITACERISTSDKVTINSVPTEIEVFERKETVGNNMEEISKKEGMTMKLEIGNHVFTAVLEENSSVEAMKELLADGPITLTMTDYAGMEKCADLGTILPQNNVQMNTQAGDLILYQGRTFVIYYDTNSWSLTPIGRIENVNTKELRQVLGTGTVTVTVSIE